MDPWEKNVPGLGLGRDPVRTPLPWAGTANGGFTSGKPWLPLGPENGRINVAGEAGDPRSMLSLYRGLLALRRREEALVTGQWAPVAAGEQALAYERRHGGRALLVALNMSGKPGELAIAGPAVVLLSTHLDRAGREGATDILSLRPDEGVIVEQCGRQRGPA